MAGNMPFDWQKLRPNRELTEAHKEITREIAEAFLAQGKGTPDHQKRVELVERGKDRKLLNELDQLGLIRNNRNHFYPRFQALYYLPDELRDNYTELLDLILRAIQKLYKDSGPKQFAIQAVEQEVNVQIVARAFRSRGNRRVYTHRAALFLLDFTRLVTAVESNNPESPISAVSALDNIFDYENLQQAWNEEVAGRPSQTHLHPAPAGKAPEATSGTGSADRSEAVAAPAPPAVSEENVDNLDELLNQANEAEQKEDFGQAGAQYERVLTLARANNDELTEAQVLVGLGRVRERQSRFARAREAFRRVNQIASNASPNSMLWQYGQEARSHLGRLRVTAPEFEDPDAVKEREALVESRVETPEPAQQPNGQTQNAIDEKKGAPEQQGVVPITRLQEFRLSKTSREVFDHAAQIANKRTPRPQPVTSSTLLFAMVDAGRTSSRAFVTPQFLQTWLASKNERGYLTAYQAYLTESGTAYPEFRDAMSANVFALLVRAREIAQETSGNTEIHSRHLLGALLVHKPGGREELKARARLARMGFDVSLLRKDFVHYLENAANDKHSAWEKILVIADESPTPGKPGAPSDFETSAQVLEEQFPESIEISSVSDVPAEKDSLGFKPYVEAISRFLASPDTKPPLTLSIEGEWGSGKSSFMRQLRNSVVGESLWARLRNAWSGTEAPGAHRYSTGTAPRRTRMWDAMKRKRQFSVLFNPWRHDKEESLWAAFALEFLRQVSREQFFLRRWWGSVKLFRAHYVWKRGWFELARAIVIWTLMLVLVVGLPIDVLLRRPRWAADMIIALSSRLNVPKDTTKSAKRSASETNASKETQKTNPEDKSAPTSDLDPLLRILLLVGGNAAYLAVILSIWMKAKDVVGNPFEVSLRKYLRSPNYEGRVAFVEQFHTDFGKIVDAYAGKEKVFVFVDDLDRCEIPKAAELMKAVNLLIADDPRLIFVLAMDRDKVAAGLAVKYEKMLPYLTSQDVETDSDSRAKRRLGLEFGQNFLQKFIQLPFRVPEPNPEQYDDFIRTISVPSGPRLPVEMAPVKESPATAEPPSTDTGPAEIGETAVKVSTPLVSPSPAEVQVRRERELQFGSDSDKVRAAASMFANTLGRNPRRLKQFLNLFRLQAYIANEIGLFDSYEVGKTRPSLTLEQLGKFVAINLRWPALLAQFAQNPTLLHRLEGFATNNSVADSTPTENEKRWLSEQQLVSLLNFGIEQRSNAILLSDYSVSSPTLYNLLHICPQRVRLPQTAGGTPLAR